MAHQNGLETISTSVMQNIYKCLFQAVGEDYQEAANHLGLKTHISKPFMIWDLIDRNLINTFTEKNVLYSVTKRGMWEILLLFDKESGMILSFMRDVRFKSIQKAPRGKKPQYIKALLILNKNLQAEKKQLKLFSNSENTIDQDQLKSVLDSLCENFIEPVTGNIKHHALVVFSTSYGQISSLQTYVLDNDLDIVSEKDWMNLVKPIMSNEIEIFTKDDVKHIRPSLTAKANKRIKQKELVALKSTEVSDKKLE